MSVVVSRNLAQNRVLTGAEPTSEPDRVPATFMDTDIDDPTSHAVVLGDRRAAGYPS